MAERNDFDASPELQELIILSIGMGINNLQKEGTLIPMIVCVENDEYAFCALEVEAAEVMDTAAKHIAELSAETRRYTLVFNGKMLVGDELFDAVIALAAERDAPHGHTVFQTYDPETSVATAELEYGGRADQWFR